MYFDGINPIRAFIKDPVFSRYFFINSLIRVLYAKITKKRLRLKKYAGKNVYDINAANDVLIKNIKNDDPFLFGRFGSVELGFVNEVLLYRKGIKEKINIKQLSRACINCGFFPSLEEYFERFTDVMLDSFSCIDIFGTFRMIQEDYYIRYFMKNDVILTHLFMMDFWRHEKPFTSALENKKVLIIHPLVDLIKEQYLKKDKIHNNHEVLPDFELKTLKAVQTSGGSIDERFNNWFEALEFMYNEAKKIDFEIAILGCGAYGLPLAAKLRNIGKTAIVMGGVTQMLFGIKGRRWDCDHSASNLYNKYWVRPDSAEIPKLANQIEDGSYW